MDRGDRRGPLPKRHSIDSSFEALIGTPVAGVKRGASPVRGRAERPKSRVPAWNLSVASAFGIVGAIGEGQGLSSAEAYSGASVVSDYEALRRADQAVLEAMPVAVCVLSADGTLVRFNQLARELWGRPPRPADGSRPRPEAATPAEEPSPVEMALRTGQPQRNREIAIDRPDGSRSVLSVDVEPMLDDAGTIEGAVCSFRDIAGHKRTEEQLRRTEQAAQQLASIVESSDDAIISKNLDGIIKTWNKAAERLFGYSADEAIGQSVLLLIPEELQDEEPHIIGRIRDGQRIEHFETRRRRKDGRLIDISLTVSPVRDAEGRVVGASKIARDISERKRSEATLARRMKEQSALYRLTEKLYRADSLDRVYDAGLDAIIDALGCDRASILLFDEDHAMRFVAWRGLSPEYRQAADGHAPWTPDTADAEPIFVDDAAAESFPEGLRTAIDAEGIGALGFIPLINGGRPIGKFMTYYNLPHAFTEADRDLALTIARQLGFSIERMRAEERRRSAEEALRDSERRLQMALDAGRMGAWEWHVDSGKVAWSPGLQDLHGIEPGTFRGTVEEFRRGVHPDDMAMVEENIRHALETTEDYHIVYRLLHPSGTIRWLEAFGRLVPRPLGKSRLMAGVCMDVTERKEAEAQRSLMVAELSHRVKNTLAIVISIARQSFATNPDANDAQRSFNARIRALGQTHSRLAEANWSGVQLKTIVTDEAAPYRREDGRNLKLSGPPVMLDPKQALTLGMALHELATNAAKYGAFSREDGSVSVDWGVAEGMLSICWSEQDGPAVTPPQRNGFGRLLLERVLAADLDGKVAMDFADTGLVCSISVPLQRPGAGS